MGTVKHVAIKQRQKPFLAKCLFCGCLLILEHFLNRWQIFFGGVFVYILPLSGRFFLWTVQSQSRAEMGLFLQNTASALPPKAINTTLTAEGIATRGSAKCFCASRKPRAALCMPAMTIPLPHKQLLACLWSIRIRIWNSWHEFLFGVCLWHGNTFLYTTWWVEELHRKKASIGLTFYSFLQVDKMLRMEFCIEMAEYLSQLTLFCKSSHRSSVLCRGSIPVRKLLHAISPPLMLGRVLLICSEKASSKHFPTLSELQKANSNLRGLKGGYGTAKIGWASHLLPLEGNLLPEVPRRVWNCFVQWCRKVRMKRHAWEWEPLEHRELHKAGW